MANVGLAVSYIVQALAVVLFVAGAATFVTLLNGCFLLRRMARGATHNYADTLLKSPMVPAISTIAIPPDASDESRQFTRRLLDLHYGRNEVVIVLDGPSEADLETWTREFRLCRTARVIGQQLPTKPVRGIYESRDPIRVVVVDKERGGAVDAWNAGVNAAASPVIGLLEPEGDFEPTVLLRLIQPMLEAWDETIAVCGGGPAPPAPGTAAQFGALESLRAWLTRGAAYAARQMVLPFPGCAVLAKRETVIKAGGFTGGKLELVLRLHALALATRSRYRIAFLPDPVCHSRVATNFEDLRRIVLQDQQEVAHAIHHRHAVAGPYGWPALRGLYWARSLRPKLEISVYVLAAVGFAAGWVSGSAVLLVLLSTLAMGMVLSMAAVALREAVDPNVSDERRMVAMYFAAIPENLGYRQLRDLWLIAGFRSSASPQKGNRGGAVKTPPAAAPVTAKKK